MGFLENAKDAAKLVQQIGNMELYDKLISLQTDAMAILDENWKLKDENRALKGELETQKQRQNVQDDVEWIEDGGFFIRKSERQAGKTIRYCPLCFTASNMALVPLNSRANPGIYGCDIHKSSYRTREYDEHVRQSNERAKRNSNITPYS
jgi:hypothetical protein